MSKKGRSNNSHTCATKKGNALNTLQNSAFSQEQLAELIRRTYKRLIELDNQLEQNKSCGAKFYRTVDAVNKLGSLLLKYLELAGISFNGASKESLAKLLSRLPKELRKQVEEVVKYAGK